MVSLRHPLSLAALAASLLVACAGKVVVNPEGATGGGGAAATSTSSTGPGSTGDAGSSGGTGGAGGCEGLETDLLAKLKAARACNPALSVPQCNGAVTALDLCGCTIVANDASSAEAQIATMAFDTWVGGGCGPFDCIFCPPLPPSAWYCDPTDAVCMPVLTK